MANRLAILVTVVVGLVLIAPRGHAEEEVAVSEPNFGFSFSLPGDRWRFHDKNGPYTDDYAGLTDYFYVFAYDKTKEANVMLIVARPGQLDKLAKPIEAWVEGVALPTTLKGYTEGYSYTVRSDQTATVTLGSGEAASARYLTYVINTNWRNVAAVFLEQNGRYVWMFVSNSGKTKDLEAIVPEIVSRLMLQ